MKCTTCGHHITNKQAFCSACGTRAPELVHKKPFPLLAVLCVALILSVIVNILLLLFSNSTSQQIEGEGFSSPEAAVMAYIKAFRNGDVDEAVSTFAIESYIECFSTEHYIQEYKNIHLNTTTLLTDCNAHYQGSNTYCRLYDVSNSVRKGYLELADIKYNTPYHFWDDEKGIDEFLKQLNSSVLEDKLSHMKIGSVFSHEAFEYDKSSYDASISTMLSYLNVIDLRDVVVELEIGGEEYYLFMLTANIDGKWYNISTSSPLGALLGCLNGPSSGLVKR